MRKSKLSLLISLESNLLKSKHLIGLLVARKDTNFKTNIVYVYTERRIHISHHHSPQNIFVQLFFIYQQTASVSTIIQVENRVISPTTFRRHN